MEGEVEALQAIIFRAKSGDRAAFDTLYTTYFTPLYRYIFVRMRNAQDTEDIVQETFLRAYQALPRYEHEHQSMLPYLFTIARNLLINHTKKKRPDVYIPEDIDRFAGGESTSQESIARELHTELRAAMELLSDAEREVIELKFFGEQTYAEIATVLGKREDAIRQHVARALKKMRTVITRTDHTTT